MSSDELVDILREHVAAKNSQNLEKLQRLMADDIVLDLEQMPPVHGRRAVLELDRYDVALNTKITILEPRSGERSVTCRLVEENDWLAAAGLEPITYEYARYTFEDGLIKQIEARLEPASQQRLGETLQAFVAWASREEPVAYATLLDMEGNFAYNMENGRRAVKLLKQWRQRVEEG